MKTLKVSLIASLIGTTVGLGSWVFGLPNHLARSCANGQLSADPPYDHRDSDYLASAD
jgi:hypothetical protein